MLCVEHLHEASMRSHLKTDAMCVAESFQERMKSAASVFFNALLQQWKERIERHGKQTDSKQLITIP